MKPQFFARILLPALVVSGGCMQDGAQRGRAAFDSMRRAVEDATARTSPGVVLVVLHHTDQSGSGSRAGRRFERSSPYGNRRTKPGIILDTEGHVLISGAVNADAIDRATIWVNDEEYHARILKADDKLDMTVLRFEPDGPITPLELSDSDLALGEWALVITPSDEEKDYMKFTGLAFCQGYVDGRYREYIVSDLPRSSSGAPVCNTSGDVVGLVYRDRVIAMSDLLEDINDFVSEAKGAKPDDESGRDAWLGVLLEPINKDYARAHELPKSAVWVTSALPDQPASKAGVRDGDLIVGLNGRPLRFNGYRTQEYLLKALRPKTGRPFSLTLRRGKQTLEVSGTFEERPEPKTLTADEIGITVMEVTKSNAIIAGLFTDTGVLVGDVQNGSAAATGGRFGEPLLIPGDVIVALGRHDTPDLQAFTKALSSLRKEKPDVVLVKFYRGRTTGFAGLNLKIGDGENGKETQP